MNVAPITLVGKRARLVPMEPAHTRGLYEAGRSPEIWTYLPLRVETYDDMVRLVQEALENKARGIDQPFVVIDQETDRIVGTTRFCDISSANRHLEIGWTWYSPEVWRTRINTECKYLLLRHCFETLETLRVQLKTDGRNIRSQRAIERIGGVREGVLRRHRILQDGYVRDSVYYSILLEEWPQVKQKLEVFLNRPEPKIVPV